MREVLLGRVQDLKEEAELLVPAILLVQVLVCFCKFEPIAPIIFLDFVNLEQRLDLLEYARAKLLALLALEVEFEFLRLRRILALFVFFGSLLEVKIIKVALDVSEAPERVGLLEFTH